MADKQVEQSIWSVRINAQLLYKKAVNGRTILLGMTAEENKKMAEVMSRAIDDIAKILEKRTTQHGATAEKEQVTMVGDIVKQEVDEEKEEKATIKPAVAPQSKVTRGPGGKFIGKAAPKKTEVKDENSKSSDSKWDSMFKKLRKS